MRAEVRSCRRRGRAAGRLGAGEEKPALGGCVAICGGGGSPVPAHRPPPSLLARLSGLPGRETKAKGSGDVEAAMAGPRPGAFPLLVRGDWGAAEPPPALKKKLLCYFQSQKRSGGGECELRTATATGHVLVCFAHPEGERPGTGRGLRGSGGWRGRPRPRAARRLPAIGPPGRRGGQPVSVWAPYRSQRLLSCGWQTETFCGLKCIYTGLIPAYRAAYALWYGTYESIEYGMSRTSRNTQYRVYNMYWLIWMLKFGAWHSPLGCILNNSRL